MARKLFLINGSYTFFMKILRFKQIFPAALAIMAAIVLQGIYCTALAQSPDSIEIHWKTEGFEDIPDVQKRGFMSSYVDLYPYAQSEKPYIVTSSDTIIQVYHAITGADVNSVDLEKFGLAPKMVRRNAERIWDTCADYGERNKYCKRFSMNSKQMKFFTKSFACPDNLARYMLQILKGGPWYGYNSVNEFTAILHWKNGEKDTLLSGRDFFAHDLYPFVKDVWKSAAISHTPQGDALNKRMLDLWLLEHKEELHRLGIYDIRPQIKELEKCFEVVDAAQLMDFGAGGGVYVKNDVPVYYAVLRTEDMPDYLEFRYIFEKRDGKFPSFENLRKDFGNIIKMVQEAQFFQKLLKEGYSRIVVSYVNDSPMSEYQIQKVIDRNSKSIFEKNPTLKLSLENNECIYVEAMVEQPEDPAKLQTHAFTHFLVHSFVIFPPDTILVSYFGNRAYYPMSYKLDDPLTWKVNSQGQIWMVGLYGRHSNSTLLDLEGNPLGGY